MSDASLVPRRLELYTSVLKRHIHLNQHLSESIPGNTTTADQPRRKAEKLWNLLGGAYAPSDDDGNRRGGGAEDEDEDEDEEEGDNKLACEHERKLFSSGAHHFGPEARRFFYSFDVTAEVQRALEGLDGGGGGGGSSENGSGSGEDGKTTLFKDGKKCEGEVESEAESGIEKEMQCGTLHKVWLEICGKKKGQGRGT